MEQSQHRSHLSKNHQAASMYAAKFGWHVFPAKGKIPLTPNGHLDATNDQNVIRDLWSKYPSANIGVAVKPSGICVLDLDTKPDRGISAHDTLIDLEQQYGSVTAPCVHTAGGGLHFYFKLDRPLKRKIGFIDAVDFLADGYAIMPPSTGESGSQYVWDSELHLNLLSPPQVPEWLERLVDDHKSEHAAYSPGFWSQLLDNGIGTGNRNDGLTQVLGHLLRRYVSPTLALPLLKSINRTHCQPPLSDDEVEKLFTSIANREFQRRQKQGA